MKRALHYIAREDAFQVALTTHATLRVYAIYENGDVLITHLTGYITEVRPMDEHWLIKTSTMKGDRDLKLYLI
jgi:hypothetical protein